MTKAEMETVIRWDREDQVPVMYTADPGQARRWVKLGYAISVMDTARDGTPRSWSAKGSAGSVRFRRVRGGMIVKRANGGQNLSVHRPILERTASADTGDGPGASSGQKSREQ